MSIPAAPFPTPPADGRAGGPLVRPLSLGKLRGMQRLTTGDGVVALCALDHRGTLRELLAPAAPATVADAALVEAKQWLTEALAPHASGVVLDPVYGLAPVVGTGRVPRATGLVVAVDDDATADEDGARLAGVLPGWSAARARRAGADAAKRLVYYHPGHAESATWQREAAQRFAAECHQADVPCIVQALVYRLPREAPAAFAARQGELVVETARQMTAFELDLLVVEFPGGLTAAGRLADDPGRARALCEAVTRAADAPWAVASAGGTPYATYVEQVRIACAAGASGFVAGRAVWGEAFCQPDAAATRAWLARDGCARLGALSEIAAAAARPWWGAFGATPDRLADVGPDWCATYGSG